MTTTPTKRPPRAARRPAGLLAAAILAFAIGAPAPADAQRQIVVAQSSDALNLDPSIDTSPISLNLFQNIFDGLTEIAADGSVQPKLATSWESNADSTEWTFTIRTDAVWHDGTPVTVDDAIWTYEKIMADEGSPVRAYLTRVDRIERVSDTALRFHLKGPFAPWPRQLTLVSIMPEAAYTSMGPEQFNLTPVGSGPFKLVSWVRDDAITLEANKDYWGGAPQVDRVIFRPVPAEATRAAALLSGELDIVPLLPPALVPRIDAASGVDVKTVESNRVLYIGFDTNIAPYSDVNLRRAIDMAINRQAITERLLRGLGVPMGQMVAEVTFGYDPEIAPTPFDPAKARELVAASSYAGEELVFLYPNNRYAFGTEVAQAMAGMLEEIGLNVRLEGMEYSAYFPLWLRNQLNSIHMFAFGPSIMDAALPLGSLFASNSRGYWSDPRVDALIEAQIAEADPAKRQALISEIWKLNSEYLPYVPIYTEVQAYGVRSRVNWEPRPDERLLFREATVND